MKIGYQLIGWHAPLDQTINHIADLGFQGVEANDLAEFLEDKNLEEQIIAALVHRGIKLSGAFFGASLVEPDRLADEEEYFRKNAQAVRRLGGEFMIVGGGKIREGFELLDPPQLYHAANRLGEIALAEGVRLAFHPHAGTLVYSPEQIRIFAERTDPQKVWFTFDTAHLQSGGGDPVKLFEKYLSRVSYVHLKDIRAGTFCELGEGEINLPAVLDVLRDAAFPGWVIVELDEPDDADRSAQINLRYLQQKLRIQLPVQSSL